MRGDIRGDLADYIKLEDADKFCAECDKEEDWMYDDGEDAQKSEYQKHLKALQDQAEPARVRKYEAEHRMEYIANLKKAIGQYQVAAASTEEKYVHIEAQEKAKVTKACEETDQWLIATQINQDKLSKSEEPVAKCMEYEQKRKALEKLAEPILNKPKPKPKPVETKKEDAKAAPADAKPADAGTGDKPVDTSKDEFMDEAPVAEDAKAADSKAADAAAPAPAEAPAAMDVEEPAAK